MIDSDGDFRVISTGTRSAINDEDERARLGTDIDFLKQIYQPDHILTPGVYYGKVTDDPNASYVQVRDSEKPYMYRVSGQNKLEKKIYANFEENKDWQPTQIHKDFEDNLDIEPIGNHRNPFTRSFIYPRLFIINPLGDGVELLNQDQIELVLKNQSHKTETLTTSRVEYVENAQMNSIQVVQKVSSL